jgi:hypothetical protein
MKSFLPKSRVYLQSYEICVDSSLYHKDLGTPLACLVALFAVVRLLVLVDFFLAVAAPVGASRFIVRARFIAGRSFTLEGLLAVLLPAVARAGFFRVAVKLRRAVFVVVDAAAFPVVAFLRVTRLVVVPSCRGFSSRERCTATTSL